MKYSYALDYLKQVKGMQEEEIKIPTLGGRSSIYVELVNSKMKITNSGNSTMIINEEYWNNVINRYRNLEANNRHIGRLYTADYWSANEGNNSTVFSPYIAAVYVYIIDNIEE